MPPVPADDGQVLGVGDQRDIAQGAGIVAADGTDPRGPGRRCHQYELLVHKRFCDDRSPSRTYGGQDQVEAPAAQSVEQVVGEAGGHPPYRAFTERGYEVVVATPGGVVPPVDRASLAPEFNGGQEGADAVAAALETAVELRRPSALEKADPGEYAAVFYPDGHGPMEDLASDADSAQLLTVAIESGTPLGLVCHGVAALAGTADGDGTSPFAGYRVTGFTRAEEEQAGLADRMEWVLEDRLVALGLRFSAGAPWAPHVVVDRTLHTGQLRPLRRPPHC